MSAGYNNLKLSGLHYCQVEKINESKLMINNQSCSTMSKAYTLLNQSPVY